MIRAILIDDEPKNTDILEKMLQRFCPLVLIAGKAENAKTGIELIRNTQPDLVFLDIEMPYGNAFDLLDQFKPINFEVIFVTAFDNYMLKAFKYSALDYLLKPVDIEELKMAVERAIERRQSKLPDIRQIEQLMTFLQQPQLQPERLALPSRDGLVFQDIKAIIRCEANRSYTCFYLTTGEKIISSRNIKEYEELLPSASFLRIHNSHLINLQFIKKYHRGRGGLVEMTDGSMLEVATRRKDELLARFGYKG